METIFFLLTSQKIDTFIDFFLIRVYPSIRRSVPPLIVHLFLNIVKNMLGKDRLLLVPMIYKSKFPCPALLVSSNEILLCIFRQQTQKSCKVGSPFLIWSVI